MRPVLIKQGAGPEEAERKAQERRAVIAILNGETPIVEDADDEPKMSAPTAYGLGDSRQLRGIPAIGRGVRGVIAGTNPGDPCARVESCATVLVPRDRDASPSRGRRDKRRRRRR